MNGYLTTEHGRIKGRIGFAILIGVMLTIVVANSVAAGRSSVSTTSAQHTVQTENRINRRSVTQDTTVTLTAVADTFVTEGTPTVNYSNSLTLVVFRDEFLQEGYALLRFDLSSIPANAIVSSAQLQLHRQGTALGPASVAMTVSRATAAWNETNVTWNTRPGLACCYSNINVGTSTAYYLWNVTSLAAGWVNGAFVNNGLALRGPLDISFERSFDSRTNSAPPRLVIQYTLPNASARLTPASIARGASGVVTGTNFVPGNVQIKLNNTVLATVSAPAGSFSTTVTIPFSTTPGLATLTVCATAYCAGAVGPQRVQQTMRVLPLLSDLSPGYVRRAFSLLESVRADAPEWSTAFLDDAVTPYYRPDVKGVAYYEFSVHAISGTLLQSVRASEQSVATTVDAGYIMLSTGEHDFPIAEWSTEGASPSHDLQVDGQYQIVTMYKLATLHHAGESGDGTLLASNEEYPLFQVDGLDGIDLNLLNGTSVYDSPSDPNAINSGIFTRTGSFANPLSVTLSPWPSWSALKLGYTDAYSQGLQIKRAHAADDWRYQHSLEEFGVALLPGESYTITLLGNATVAMSGTGVSHIQTTTLPGALRVTALSAIQGQSLPFDVMLDYIDGRNETVKFVIVDMVLRGRVFLPMILSSTQAQSTQTLTPPTSATLLRAPDAPQDVTHLRWEYFYAAGGTFGQRVWDQLDPYESPNTTECPSGCGGTAWAMLFGWADYRASVGDTRWANQWGLYRQNGGVTTINVAAPRYMRTGGDAAGVLTPEGVGVGNMMMEIRSDIHTFCFTSAGGATTMWDMDNAFRYADRRRYARIYASAEYNLFNNEWGHIYNQIRYNQTPSIMLTGSLLDGSLHYPLAYAVSREWVRECGWDWFVNWPVGGTRCEEKARNASFRINIGWGRSTSFRWVPASTGFYTVMYPR